MKGLSMWRQMPSKGDRTNRAWAKNRNQSHDQRKKNRNEFKDGSAAYGRLKAGEFDDV